jgi:hypothetical protein
MLYMETCSVYKPSMETAQASTHYTSSRLHTRLRHDPVAVAWARPPCGRELLQPAATGWGPGALGYRRRPGRPQPSAAPGVSAVGWGRREQLAAASTRKPPRRVRA